MPTSPTSSRSSSSICPRYIASGALADLAEYGAKDVKDKFVPWTVVAGLTGRWRLCLSAGRRPDDHDVQHGSLDADGIKAPTTWDEFTKAAADHAQGRRMYFANFTADQGWFFGMLWQSGATPFTVDGTNITIDFTSPEVTRVAQAVGRHDEVGQSRPGRYVHHRLEHRHRQRHHRVLAGRRVGHLQSRVDAQITRARWKVLPDAAVDGRRQGQRQLRRFDDRGDEGHRPSARKPPTFAKWLNTDPAPTLELANPDKAGLFPVTQSTLSTQAWSDFP